jgi:macrocin-O-methyltransferase TylF-like protien
VRELLTRIGAHSSDRVIHFLDSSVNYLEIGRWMKARRFDVSQRLTRREMVFAEVAREIGSRPVLYLEFGVFRGASLLEWARLLDHPGSRFHAFDSFRGLPVDWAIDNPRGHFDIGGIPPSINDDRVTFFPGWFEETLTKYTPPSNDQLVINLDADLYSSTKTVLDRLAPHIVVGSYLYFDEFSNRNHELRAFSELLDRTGMRFRVVAVTRALSNVAFQRTE